MFDNDYQTNVLISDNHTLYINNVWLRGVYKSDPHHEGVIFHYWEPLSNKCSAHLLLIHLMNFKHIPYHTLSFAHRSLIVHHPTPLFLIILFPSIYTPIPPYISPKTHTTLKLYLSPKRVFCHKMPIISYWQILKTII